MLDLPFLQLLEDLLLVWLTPFSQCSIIRKSIKEHRTDEATGYNQGIMPITLTMKQFISQVPQTNDAFWTNFLIDMSQLGGFLGALTMG